MLEINNLFYKIKDKLIFNNINLKVNKEEKVLIYGNNGLGKSTLLNIIANVINNKKYNIKNNFKNIFYISDKYELLEDITTYELLDLFNKISKSIYMTNYLIKELHIENRLIKRLSKGNRQKVVLALGLISNAELILIDEVIDGLDKTSINNYIKLILKDNKTYIFISHNKSNFNRKGIRKIELIDGILNE